METKVENLPEKKLTGQMATRQDDGAFSINGFEHAQRVAKMLSSSDLVPTAYKGNIANTMIAMEMSGRCGASPLMVMQNLHVIQGKPSWSSPFIIASLNSCGRFTPIQFKKSGEGDEYGYEAFCHDKAGNLLEGPKVTWKMVKEEGWLGKPGSKWKTMPELMFRYRAAAFFGRLYAPDILMGMQTVEEVIDVNGFIQTPSGSTVETTPEDLQMLLDMKRDFLSEEDVANAERIINNQETASYNKLLKLLQSK